MPLPFQPKPIDADAAAYIARSGATDRAAINAFVRGVKALGLWNSMVCWPLRSSQNAGTGDTVYSLGGLGTFNGTLVNFSSGAWTADGITFDGSNDYIITPLEANDHPNGISELVVFNAPADTANFAMFFGDENAAIGGHATMIRRSGTDNAVAIATDFTSARANATQGMTFGQWNAVHARIIAPTNFISVNSTAETSSTASGAFAPVNPTADRVGFGARDKSQISGYPAGFHAKMTAAFGAFWSSGTSASQMQAVKSLYKSTLGQGFGLP